VLAANNKMLTVLGFLLGTSIAHADDGFRGFTRSLNDKPYGWTQVSKPEPVRAGALAQRFEVRGGDCGAENGWSDCANDRERSEFYSRRRFGMGEEVWIAWSVFFPKDYWDSTDFHTVVGQIHQEGGTRGMPPLAQLVTERGSLSIMYHELDGTPYNIEDYGIKTDLVRLDAIKGRWTDVMIHVNFSKADGFLEVYIDGKKKYDLHREAMIKNQRVGYSVIFYKNTDFIVFEPQNFYFKYGIYRNFISNYTNRTGQPVPTQILYYDEVRVGSDRASVDIRGNAALAAVD
jgi:Polysaccharide lyase